jgi:hypothetical protein
MAQSTARSDLDTPARSGANPSTSSALRANRSGRGVWIAICAALLVALGLFVWYTVWIDLGWFSASLPAIDTSNAGSQREENSSPKHPLETALSLAREVQNNIEENVHDYTATLIKQERIGNELSPEQVCFVKIREKPFSVYMDFLAPPDLKGREAAFVAGKNDDQLIGHEGSGLLSLAGSKWLSPTSPLAMIGQHYPITELGIANLTRRLIEIGEKDMAFGECYVWRNDDAKVGDRPCISITVMHPERRPNFLFYVARIFVDKELMVPLHYEAFDWPEKPGEKPPLIERYTYTRLKLNPGLTDEDFDPHNPQYSFYSK